jgi:putative transposase
MKSESMLAYKFRLYPNKEEERKLLRTKEVCRQTYNKFLELYYEGEHDRFKLQALLPVWKKTDGDIRGVHSKVLQYELLRLFSNLEAIRELEKLRREQRRLSRKQNGSKNYKKQRIIVARTHERICDQRNDFQHKLSRYYVDSYDLIVTENLDIKEMIQNGHLTQSINDAAWSSFNQKLAYKAERAGKLFVQVDTRGTSQTCPRCGRVESKSLSQRTHDCPCGFCTSRDHASSLVILDRGLRKVRSERPELTLVDGRPLQPSANGLQAAWMKQEATPARAG